MGGFAESPTSRRVVPWPVPPDIVAAWLRADKRRRHDVYCTVAPEEREPGAVGTEAMAADVHGAIVCIGVVWLVGVMLGMASLVTAGAPLALVVAAGVGLRHQHEARREEADHGPRTTIEGYVTVKVNGHGVRCQMGGRHRTIPWSDVVGVMTMRRTLVLTCQNGHEIVFHSPWNRPSPTLGLVSTVAGRVAAAHQAHLAANDDLFARMARGLSRPEQLVTAERGLSAADD